jgi:hypothetical protein
VVRLEAGTQKLDGPLSILLTPEDGAPLEIALKNDGAPPDVTKDDGTWSGTVWAEGDTFGVQLVMPSGTIKGDEISWKDSDAQRDLSVFLKDGAIRSETSSVQSNTAPNAQGAQPSGTVPTPPSSTAPAGAASSPPLDISTVSSDSSDSTLYLVMGAGGLLLILLGYLWMSGRDRVELPSGVSLIPEAGSFGEGTPSLSSGLSTLVVSTNPLPLLKPLLATMARSRRVVVGVPPRTPVPSVPGGPVYRVELGKPAAFGEVVAELAEPVPGGLAVLILADNLDASQLKKLTDNLPEGIGGVILTVGVPPIGYPSVQCIQEGDCWKLSFSEQTLLVRETPAGFIQLQS